MLKRQPKTETPINDGPGRILVVDDHPDAAKLLAKLLRRSGYEVAEVADDHVALLTLTNEPTPITAVVASFSSAGTGAALKLLDGIRHAADSKVNQVKVIVLSDSPNQQLFAWQSGADAIVNRPFSGELLVSEVHAVVRRSAEQRVAYRGEQIARLTSSPAGRGMSNGTAPVEFN